MNVCNMCVLIGNLVEDPKLTTTQSGIPKCTFRLAVQRDYAGPDGKKEADFFNIVVWRNNAANCANYLKKGSKCAINGSLQTRSYDAQDGTTRYITELVAESVKFLNAPKQQQSAEYAPPANGNQNFVPDNDDELPF